jgi:hypothetical protein
MPKITLEHIDRVEIELAIQKSGGIELLGAMLGISGRQIRNYLKSGMVPKLAAERIRQLGRA